MNFIGSRVSFLCPCAIPNNTLETNVSRYEDNIDRWCFIISVLLCISSNLNSYCTRFIISRIWYIGGCWVEIRHTRLWARYFNLKQKKTNYAFKYELCNMDPMIINVLVAWVWDYQIKAFQIHQTCYDMLKRSAIWMDVYMYFLCIHIYLFYMF